MVKIRKLKTVLIGEYLDLKSSPGSAVKFPQERHTEKCKTFLKWGTANFWT